MEPRLSNDIVIGKCEICGKDTGGKVNGHVICLDCYDSDDIKVISKITNTCGD
jgi:uncharacterized membrane protein